MQGHDSSRPVSTGITNDTITAENIECSGAKNTVSIIHKLKAVPLRDAPSRKGGGGVEIMLLQGFPAEYGATGRCQIASW